MAHEKFTAAELESQADVIMDRFNFDKIHAHMVAINHKWLIGYEMVIPTLSEIRISARVLLSKAIYHNDPTINIGTGGFVVYKMPWGLQLTFQLAWS